VKVRKNNLIFLLQMKQILQKSKHTTLNGIAVFQSTCRKHGDLDSQDLTQITGTEKLTSHHIGSVNFNCLLTTPLNINDIDQYAT